MPAIALIPGGGDSSLSWQPVVACLAARGHRAIAVDLPSSDPAAGWGDYAAAVVRALGSADEVVVVAHSLGGFTAPLVCQLRAVRLLVLVAAMIPTPGAKAADYWGESGYVVAAQFDDAVFYHDLTPEALALAKRAEVAQEERPMHEPWPLAHWPEVTTRYLLCRNNRVFPAEVTRRLVRERLGLIPDEIDAGHCVQLARPAEFCERLHAYASALAR